MMYRLFTLAGLTAALVGVPFAQVATPQQQGTYAGRNDMGTIHVETNLGSFRLIDGEGRVTFSFKGTVMISGLKGTVSQTGNIKLEHETKDGSRRFYSGQGTFTVDGKWRAVQWFGSDMKLTMFGKGIVRVTGEFDRNLNTGRYWYNKPDEWLPLPSTSMMTLTVPQATATPTVQPRERPKTGG